MGDSNDPGQAANLALEQGFQDGLIARALPAWMRKLGAADAKHGDPAAQPGLSAQQLAALLEAFKTSLYCKQHLGVVLRRIQGIEQYCRPLLQRALREHLSVTADSSTLYLRHHYFSLSPRPEWAAGHVPQQQQNDFDIPLLNAALANFTQDEARGNGLPRKDCIVTSDGSEFAGMTAVAFAGCCRKLDLGERYQEHLDSVLGSFAEEVPSGHGIVTSLKALQASSMLVDACRARSEGLLTDEELQLVIGMYRDGRPGVCNGRVVHARQLTAFGCRLEQIVVLDMIDDFLGFKSSARVLVHIPDDPVSPWSAAADLDAFIRRTLGKRLARQPYQRFFSRFIRRRDRPAFFAQVSETLVDVADWAARDMDQHMVDYPLPLFAHLARAWVEQAKDDAAFIAVPVTAIDRMVEREQRNRLVSSAWMIAGVAGLFVPGLNAFLLAVAAWNLLKEVFHAVEAWGEGDTRAALDHVLDVFKRLVEVGATALVIRTVGREWRMVDSMVTARLESGAEKLWQFDLKPFRCAPPPVQAQADTAGLYRLGERCWVNMDGAFFEVVQRPDEQWQIKPIDGHGPLLRHNEAGAWRVWCEQPIEWGDTYRMFRRLGAAFSDLEDEQIDHVLAIHDMQAEHLRGMHVCNRAPHACLVDTVNRVALMNRIQALTRQLRSGEAVVDSALLARVQRGAEAEAVPASELAERVWARRHALLQQLYYEQYPVTAATHELQRDFVSLHRLAAEELLAAASQRLAYHAADLARHIRCVRAHEALLFDMPQDLNLARVVLAGLNLLQEGAAAPGWQLFDGDASEPLASFEGAGPTLRLRFRGGVFHLEGAEGQTEGTSGDLFELVATALRHEQRIAMDVPQPFATYLRAQLARQVAQQQLVIAQVLGIRGPTGFFLPPQRFGQSLVGYPLSGCRTCLGIDSSTRRPASLVAQLRDLYPGFSDQQVDDWLERMRVSQRDPAEAVSDLEHQLRVLTRYLLSWQRGTPRIWAWNARRQFARGLEECWRYLAPSQLGGERNSYMLNTYGSNLDELPSIPRQVSFAHVSQVALRGLQLRRVPEGFLPAFRSLSELYVTNCRLRSIPVLREMAPQLKVLDLSGNQIRLDGRAKHLLARCRSLIYLNLSHNPLRQPFSIAQMQNLHVLMLGNAQLTEVPTGLMQVNSLHTLDLADNTIRGLPFGFYRSGLWLAGRVRLSGNPLDGAGDEWHEVDDDQVPTSLRWLDLVKVSERDRMASIWGKLEGQPEATDFFHLLKRLTTSADFLQVFTARYLALRVQRMLAYMATQPELQKELYAHALSEHCQDNATLRFSDLEVRVKVWKALNERGVVSKERALLSLGAQCWRLQALDHLAALHAARAGRAEESLEFALAYRLALVEHLDLPIEHDEMLNPGVASLTGGDLAEAARQVRSAQSRVTLADFLIMQRFWKEYLTQAFATRLEVPQSLHDELEALIERNAPEQEINQLHDHVQARTRNVQLRLTREAIGRHLPAVSLTPPVP